MHSAQLCGVSLIEERFRGDGAGRLDKGCLLSMGYKADVCGGNTLVLRVQLCLTLRNVSNLQRKL